MFSLAKVQHPSSWVLSGAKSRPFALDQDEVDIVAGIYNWFQKELGLQSFAGLPVEDSAVQIRGKLWCGRRYYEAYFFSGSNDLKMFNNGACVISFHSRRQVKQYAVIRDIWKHQPYRNPGCLDFYVFQIQLLHVTWPPPIDEFDFSCDVLPLPVAVLDPTVAWV
jgi:hypothetical protein